MVSTWVLYIPRVKERLEIDDAQLGIALFCFALGTLCMIPLSSFIIDKLGVGKTTLIGISIFSVLFLLPIISYTYYFLCFSLFLVGVMACLTDVSMNALVSEIEQKDNVHIMSSSHGFFSLGGVIGAGAGSLLLLLIKIPLQHMLLATLVVLISNILLCKSYISIRGEEKKNESVRFQWSLLKSLLGFTIIAFIVMGSEGAIEHWSGLYLKEIIQVSSESVIGLGFLVFSIMMTIGRFLGDHISERFGSLKIIMGGCFLATIGFLLVLSSFLYTTILGFGFVGAGFSVIIPELFRLAGKSEGISTARGISLVAGFGYVGFLISPPFLGFLSKLSSLKLSFLALFIGTLIVLSITIILKIKSKNK